MAAIDKTYEFYTCLKRFAFLCECYAPEGIKVGSDLSDAFFCIQNYAKDPEVMKLTEEAEEYFDECDKRIQRRSIADIIAKVLEEVAR